MQWFHGDHTMLEMIEKKRCLCKEIKARQKTEKGLCKQDSMPILPSWKKNAGTKKYSPPPYSKQQTVFWDTAIWACTGVSTLLNTKEVDLVLWKLLHIFFVDVGFHKNLWVLWQAQEKMCLSLKLRHILLSWIILNPEQIKL